MAEDRYVWFQRLDGMGEECLDLYSCRRFRLRGPSAVGGLWEFYMTPDERWVEIECGGINDDGTCSWFNACQERNPIEVTHYLGNLYFERRLLPAQLEEFREFMDEARFYPWLDQHPHANLRSPVKPTWDRDRLVLSVDGFVCREFKRSRGNNQIALIEAFDKASWPKRIRDPFSNPNHLDEAVKKFNSTVDRRAFQFARMNRMVAWRFSRPGNDLL